MTGLIIYLRMVSYLVVFLISVILRQKSCYKYIFHGSAIFAASMLVAALARATAHPNFVSVGNIAITFGAFMWAGLFFAEMLRSDHHGE